MRSENSKVTVVGAGLVGSLTALVLAKRGFDVEMHERRPDMRREKISAGRSINLAVSVRGLHALKHVGLEERVLKEAVPMRGRMMHARDGALTFQAYGVSDSQCINSVSRGALNKLLMSEAEATGRVRIHFNSKVEKLPEGLVLATDGSYSAIRDLFRESIESTSEELSHGYKELSISAGAGGKFKLEKNALHIWPRGTFMMIALPNIDGSFTCTLFLANKGTTEAFTALENKSQIRLFFEEHFGDACPILEKLEETFQANPTGTMVTVKCNPWHFKNRVLLLGDAAHAIVPFFGQGMNCGFEDVTTLDELLDEHGDDWQTIMPLLTARRKTNADAIADMAVENFIEMRDKVGDPRFLLEKAVEKILQEKFPGRYHSRYGLVTFSRTPYREAYEIGLKNQIILDRLCKGLKSPGDLDLKLAGEILGA